MRNQGYGFYLLRYGNMKITPDDIRHVAKLARLEIAETDIASFVSQIGEILNYVDTLNKAATDDVTPMAHAIPLTNAFREDAVRESGPLENILKNAPAAVDNMFRVPKIIE